MTTEASKDFKDPDQDFVDEVTRFLNSKKRAYIVIAAGKEGRDPVMICNTGKRSPVEILREVLRTMETLTKEGVDNFIVHVLREGRALCGLPGVPRDWPPGHRWVSHSELQLANCQECHNSSASTTADTTK